MSGVRFKVTIDGSQPIYGYTDVEEDRVAEDAVIQAVVDDANERDEVIDPELIEVVDMEDY